MLDDIWDSICEGWSYFWSFEWLGDIWEFFTGMFENIGDFSILGLAFAVSVVIFVYLLRDQMLLPFLVHMGTMEAYFWGGATYVGSAIIGYLIGKKLLEE